MKNPWITGAIQIWSEIVVKLWQFLSLENIQLVVAHEKKKNYTFIVCNPNPLSAAGVVGGGGGRSASNQIFKKGEEPDRGRDLKISTFRGGDVFQEVQFSPKNKVKSGIFNDKKSLQGKIFFSAITKNSNCEILPKNLATFKR